MPGYPGAAPFPGAASFPAAPQAPFKPAAVNAALATGYPGSVASAPALPAPKVRAHSADPTPAPPRLVLPTPESLGLGVAKPSAPPMPSAIKPVDWNLAHQRLKDLGAVGLHVDQPRAGQVRVTFWLPTTETGRTQLIEATAGDEADAVSLALRQAETARLARR